MDIDLLHRFEAQLIPHDLSRSTIPVQVIGYGEISSILIIGDDDSVVYKRLPLFTSKQDAEAYLVLYREYYAVLKAIGLNLPDDSTAVIQIPGRLAAIYFQQKRLPAASFCHTLINHLEWPVLVKIIEAILARLEKLWEFNLSNRYSLETAVDAQLSNWAWTGPEGQEKLYLVDTSTPFLRKKGVEQLDVETLLKSVPGLIRWAIRRLNLDDIIGRYYDTRKVLIDLVGNLHKEQRPDLIPPLLAVINGRLTDKLEPLKKEEVDSYYKEDKLIWTLFSGLRRADRLLTTKVLRKRYEFILPGRVQR